ncbi:MAG: hypothetical protein ACK52W_02770, partial [Alphaproteobacteria bacterium]
LEQTQRLGHGLEENTPLDAATRTEEKLLMGLRLIREGLNLKSLHEDERALLLPRLVSHRLKKLQDEHLITYENECLCVTPKGALLLNAITAALGA